MQTFTITTRNLWDNYLKTMSEVLWESSMSTHRDFDVAINVLTKENMDGIRKMFKEGFTVCLLNETHVDYLNENGSDNVEVRIFNRHGNYIGSVVGKELNF